MDARNRKIYFHYPMNIFETERVLGADMVGVDDLGMYLTHKGRTKLAQIALLISTYVKHIKDVEENWTRAKKRYERFVQEAGKAREKLEIVDWLKGELDRVEQRWPKFEQYILQQDKNDLMIFSLESFDYLQKEDFMNSYKIAKMLDLYI
ncbi:MAG: hypothetical protein ACPLY9_01475 [Nitrososphaerales archaeon]